MSKTYVILGRDNYPGAPIREICRCNGRADDIKNALTVFKEIGPLGTLIPRFNHVEILDLTPVKKAVAQMRHPDRNIRFLPDKTANQLLAVLQQIDAMRADNGDEAAQGPSAQARPSLSQRNSEAEQP